MATPVIGRGSTVSVGGSPVGNITGVDWSGVKCEAVKANYLDQPDAYNVYIAGPLDGGTLTFDMQWTSAGHATVLALIGTMADVAVTKGGTTLTFEDALCTDAGSLSISNDAVMSSKFSFQLAGAPTAS